MRFVRILLIASVAVASPSYATFERVDSEESLSETQREIDAFFRELNGRNYKVALKIASKVDVAPSKEGQALKSALRAAALLGLNRADESRKLFAAANSDWPDEPFVSSLQFETALLTKNWDVAADALDIQIARFPDVVREIGEDFMWFFLRNEPSGQERRNDDRRSALARLGYGGANGDYMTENAVRILVKRGDVAAANDLVRFIDEPEIIENLLIQKQFSALWSAIEPMAGPGLEKVRASSVLLAEADFKKDPASHEKLKFLVNALRHAGRLDEAIALRGKLPSTPEEISAADEDMGWAFNNVALALNDSNRPDEADALFSQLNTAKIPKDSWRVSMIINRLELLVLRGNYAKAADLLSSAEATASINGSPYAQQLVRRHKYCVLSKLGRRDEAAVVRPMLIEHAKDAYHATIDGLLCVGDLDEAEKVTLAALTDDDFQKQFVRALQPVKLTSDDPSVWEGRWKELRNRPAIAKEYDRLGRDMPAQFLPPKKS